MQHKEIRNFYITKELHKKIKLYCLKNDIFPISKFIEPILEAAVTKPKATERLEIARQELLDEGFNPDNIEYKCDFPESEEHKRYLHEYNFNAGIGLGGPGGEKKIKEEKINQSEIKILK